MFMALARERAPSAWSLVEAPVKILTLKGRPSACSCSALLARASGTALGVPGAVNPEKPIVAPLKIKDAASSAVIKLNDIIFGIDIIFFY